MSMRTGSKALIREINEALVLDVVRSHGSVARAGIVERTGLSAATVTGITGRLVATGLLDETESVRGARGRPATLLRLGSRTPLTAGVRISAHHVDVVLVTLRGEVVGDHRVGLADTAVATVVTTVGEAVAAAVAAGARAGLPGVDDVRAGLSGIGVAVSGVVDHDQGVVGHSGALGWEGVGLRDLLGEVCDAAVSIDSYVNCLTHRMSLFADHPVPGHRMVVSLGISLGASIVVDGRLQRGHDGSAGGLAHTRIGSPDAPGLRCHCGADGCLETVASGWGIRRALERLGREVSLTDPAAATTVDTAAFHLARGLATIAKVLGPEQVVLAVGPEPDLSPVVEAVAPHWAEEYRHHQTPPPTLETARADERTVATGAAYVSLSELFSPAASA